MNKAIFKQSFFYLAVLNFILALVFISQSSLLAHFASFVWFLSFLLNLYRANKAVHKKWLILKVLKKWILRNSIKKFWHFFASLKRLFHKRLQDIVYVHIYTRVIHFIHIFRIISCLTETTFTEILKRKNIKKEPR